MTPRVVALLLGVSLVSACGSSDNFSGANAKSSAAKKPAASADAKPAATAKPTPAATKPAAPPATKPSAVFTPEVPPVTTTPAAPVTPVAPPQGAVTKGSFTVWTEPADPAPFQDYTVVIEVKLPVGTASYDAGDLSGSVDGTDGYHQTIGDGAPQPFEFFGANAHLRMFVPGALDHVRDTVQIHSTLLNENQSIGIEF